jgi:hypothetical protein
MKKRVINGKYDENNNEHSVTLSIKRSNTEITFRKKNILIRIRARKFRRGEVRSKGKTWNRLLLSFGYNPFNPSPMI